MNSAGDATTFIRRTLERIAIAYGIKDCRVSVGPTLLLLRYADADVTVVDFTATSPVELGLDQVSELYYLISRAEAGAIDPVVGLESLRAIGLRRQSSGALARIAGLTLISGGLNLVLGPSLQALVVSCLLGAIVGMVRLTADRWPALWPLVPVVAGSVVTALGFLLIDAGLEVGAVDILIPPLAVFLPGAAITVAIIELSAGDIVSGSSRLAFGAIRLLLLLFGIVISAQWVQWDTSTASSEVPRWLS